TFAETYDAKDRVVATLVVALEWFTPPDVTDRVDAPGDMMDEENPHESAPDESEQYACPTHGQKPTQDCWDQESKQNPKWEERTHPAYQSIFFEIRDITRQSRCVWFEEPSHVRVVHASDRAEEPAAVRVW